MFGSTGFGEGYYASLPEEVYIFIPPTPVAPVEATSGAPADADFLQSGGTFPLVKKKKKGQIVLPETPVDFESEQEIQAAPEIIEEILHPDVMPEISIPIEPPDIDKPAFVPIRPKIPASPEVVEHQEKIKTRDRRREIKLAEDAALLGFETKDHDKRFMEDMAILEDEF